MSLSFARPQPVRGIDDQELPSHLERPSVEFEADPDSAAGPHVPLMHRPELVLPAPEPLAEQSYVCPSLVHLLWRDRVLAPQSQRLSYSCSSAPHPQPVEAGLPATLDLSKPAGHLEV